MLEAADAESAIAFLPGGGFIVLDTHVTPELEAEGLARDVVRAVQQARKDAGLDVSDRIALQLWPATPRRSPRSRPTATSSRPRRLPPSLEAREAGGGTVPVGTDSRIAIEVERA